MELLRIAEGLDMVHGPYKGGAGPAVTGLMGGETHVMFTTAASAIGQVRGGKLKLLAVTSPRRMEQAPSAPTMVESGYPDFVTGSWQGVFVPAGTPRDIVERLFTAVQSTMGTPELAERLKNGGAEVVTSQSSAAFAEFVAAETRRWARVVRDWNPTPDWGGKPRLPCLRPRLVGQDHLPAFQGQSEAEGGQDRGSGSPPRRLCGERKAPF